MVRKNILKKLIRHWYLYRKWFDTEIQSISRSTNVWMNLEYFDNGPRPEIKKGDKVISGLQGKKTLL